MQIRRRFGKVPHRVVTLGARVASRSQADDRRPASIAVTGSHLIGGALGGHQLRVLGVAERSQGRDRAGHAGTVPAFPGRKSAS